MEDNIDSKKIGKSVEIFKLFPIPVYQTYREIDLDLSEKKDVEDIIEEGFNFDGIHSFSKNSYIFDTKLKKIKEFCEEHIKAYAREIVSPKEELDFYITQSWLNLTKPGQCHQMHSHANSIISGAFYIQTDVGQIIECYNKSTNHNPTMMVDRSPTDWNSNICFNVTNNQLLLFPSWLVHGVPPNEHQTKNVISISFNTFVKGTLGDRKYLDELILH